MQLMRIVWENSHAIMDNTGAVSSSQGLVIPNGAL